MPFSETDTILFGISYERTIIDMTSNIPPTYQNYTAKNGRITNNFPIAIDWSKDQHDSTSVPTHGRYQQANLELGIPGSDLQYSHAYYQRQYFYPPSKSLTTAFNNEIGYDHSYGGKDFPIFKNYYAGGIDSVHDYEVSTLDLCGANGVAIGGASKFTGNMEFTFPLSSSDVDRTVRLFTFLDYGNVSVEGQPYKLGDMCCSTGFGLSWLSLIGPLKISMGFPIKRKTEDQTQRFRFQIGTTF